jgi:hypothetical protein
MPWIRSFKHFGIWVSFTENDFHEISCVAFGLTQTEAEARTYNKIVKAERGHYG